MNVTQLRKVGHSSTIILFLAMALLVALAAPAWAHALENSGEVWNEPSNGGSCTTVDQLFHHPNPGFEGGQEWVQVTWQREFNGGPFGVISCAVFEDRPPQYLRVRVQLFKDGAHCWTSPWFYNADTGPQFSYSWYYPNYAPNGTSYYYAPCGQGDYEMVGHGYARTGSEWFGGPLYMEFHATLGLPDRRSFYQTQMFHP